MSFINSKLLFLISRKNKLSLINYPSNIKYQETQKKNNNKKVSTKIIKLLIHTLYGISKILKFINYFIYWIKQKYYKKLLFITKVLDKSYNSIQKPKKKKE